MAVGVGKTEQGKENTKLLFTPIYKNYYTTLHTMKIFDFRWWSLEIGSAKVLLTVCCTCVFFGGAIEGVLNQVVECCRVWKGLEGGGVKMI